MRTERERARAKAVKLKDGTEVRVRPMRKEDLNRSLSFFRTLADKDRRYLRRDVTRREVVRERIGEMESGGVKRLVAVAEDSIVADGALELSGPGWRKHIGELRLIVAPSHRRNGLGIVMARELYGLAASARVEEIVVSMMRPQIAARKIFGKLGFHEETFIPDYVKDRVGKKQDLILMRCDLKALWQRLEDYLVGSDWQRTR